MLEELWEMPKKNLNSPWEEASQYNSRFLDLHCQQRFIHSNTSRHMTIENLFPFTSIYVSCRKT